MQHDKRILLRKFPPWPKMRKNFSHANRFFLHSIMSFACDWQLVSMEVDSIFEETHHGWNIATICNRNESVSQHWHTHLEVLAIFSDGFLCSVYLWMWFILWLAWFRMITEWFDRANWIIWLNQMEINEFILFSCTLQVFTLQGTTENSLFFLMCQKKNGAPYNTQHTKWNTVGEHRVRPNHMCFSFNYLLRVINQNNRE